MFPEVPDRGRAEPDSDGAVSGSRGPRADGPIVGPEPVGNRLAPPLPRVAVAVVLRRGRDGHFWVLISRRPAHAHLADCWEFPGGKALPAESDEECARREVEEETGLRVEVVSRLGECRHEYPDRAVLLRFLLCAYRGGIPQTRGCRAVRWVRPENLDVYSHPDANRTVLDWLRGPAVHLAAALGPEANGHPDDP